MATLKVTDADGNSQDLSASSDGEGLVTRHTDDPANTKLTAIIAALAGLATQTTLAAINAVLGTINTAIGGLATQTTLAAVNTALGTISTTLSTISTGIGTAVTHLANILAQNTITTPIVGSITSGGTTEVALPNIPVKVPIHISIPPGFVGTLTIRDADGGGTEVLGWSNADGHHKPEAVFYGDNLNDYTYQTSTSGQSFTYRSAS